VRITAAADQEPLPHAPHPLQVLGAPQDRHHAAVERIVEGGQIPVAPAGARSAAHPFRVLLRLSQVVE
jgi:hypothetical protein